MKKRKRLLIVDFDRSCLDFFSRVMKKHNAENYQKGKSTWRVLDCDTGCGALAVTDKERPDFALVELKLHDMDGLFLVGMLSHQGIDVYVSSSQDNQFVEAIRSGAKMCFKKPLDAGKFLAILKEYEDKQ